MMEIQGNPQPLSMDRSAFVVHLRYMISLPSLMELSEGVVLSKCKIFSPE